MRFAALFFSALLFTLPAQAQVYGDLTYEATMKTIFRFGAVNLNDDNVIDDFSKVALCDTYKRYLNDDFAMRDFRTKLRAKLPKITASFPNAYYFMATMNLDHYDFLTKQFLLDSGSRLENVNSFVLTKAEGDICVKNSGLKVLPKEIGARIDQPVTLEGLPIDEARAKALIDTMNVSGNTARTIYARFSMLITYAAPLTAEMLGRRYNMDAQLLNIEFFEDPQHTKPIWVYTRN